MSSSGPALQSFALSPMTRDDWPAVRAIYESGIATGHATFEPKVPSWEEWDRSHAAAPRLVARDAGGAILGWAAVSPVSGRCVYAGVGEVSVYVGEGARERGVGRALLAALVEGSARVSGRCRPASFPRTARASRCTGTRASARWACASASER
jgi:L-amino acid N-acyltransferase YncA